mgnify:CR=1 FL=1
MEKTNFLKKIHPFLESYAEAVYDDKFGESSRVRKGWYASDLGKCLRGAYYARAGAKPKEVATRVEAIGHEGKMKELEIIVKMVLDGIEIIDVQKRLFDPNLNVSGRIDVLFKMPGNPIIPEEKVILKEIKTVNSRAFWYRMNKITQTFKPYEHHKKQTMFYLHYLRQEYPNISAHILYKSRDDGTEVIAPIIYDEKMWESIESDLTLLNKAWDTKNPNSIPLPGSVIYDEQRKKYVVNWQAKYCDYHHYCLGGSIYPQNNWLAGALNLEKSNNKQFLKVAKKYKFTPVEVNPILAGIASTDVPTIN